MPEHFYHSVCGKIDEFESNPIIIALSSLETIPHIIIPISLAARTAVVFMTPGGPVRTIIVIILDHTKRLKILYNGIIEQSIVSPIH